MVAADFKFGKNFGRLAAEKNLYLAVDAFLAMRAGRRRKTSIWRWMPSWPCAPSTHAPGWCWWA